MYQHEELGLVRQIEEPVGLPPGRYDGVWVERMDEDDDFQYNVSQDRLTAYEQTATN